MPDSKTYDKKSEEISRQTYQQIIFIGAATILAMIIVRFSCLYLIFPH
jgi:hypothetical protein